MATPAVYMWLLLQSVLLVLFFSTSGQFDLRSEFHNPCDGECKCDDWQREEGLWLVVNCSSMNFSLFQGLEIPKNIPQRAKVLIVSNYMLGALSWFSFPNTDYALNIKLRSISLVNCGITHLLSNAFQGNTFVVVQIITLSYNMLEEIVMGTFGNLIFLEILAIDSNYLKKIQSAQPFRTWITYILLIYQIIRSLRYKMALLIMFHY